MTAAQAAQMLLDSDLEDVFDNDYMSDDFESKHSDTDDVQSTAANVRVRVQKFSFGDRSVHICSVTVYAKPRII